MKRRVAILAAAAALSGCASREQIADRMAQRYDIPVEAALYVGDRCPIEQFSLVASLNGCRRRAARTWNEEHPQQQISTALDLDQSGGAFFFVPVR